MLLATVTLPPEGLALERTVESVPEIEIEAERIAAHGTKWVMPCLWIARGEAEEVEEAFRFDPSIAETVECVPFGDELFCQVEWAEAVERRIDSYVDKEGSVLEARLREGEWEVTFRFAHRTQFDEFRDRLSDRGYSFQLLNLSEAGRPRHRARGVTPSQRDALVTAAERGYFRVPRDATTAEVAEELGVSSQAVSERIRRGIENLVFSTLTARDAPNSGGSTTG